MISDNKGHTVTSTVPCEITHFGIIWSIMWTSSFVADSCDSAEAGMMTHRHLQEISYGWTEEKVTLMRHLVQSENL